MTYKSVYSTQQEILEAIVALHAPEGFDCDLTYGNGSFWPITPPRLCFDIKPSAPHVKQACSTSIPTPDNTLVHTIFDPPFLTYIKDKGERGKGTSIMSKRFGGYWSYQDLEAHYRATLKDISRALKPNHTLTFKCQDIVHNHKLHPTHINVTRWAEEENLRLKDLFILPAVHRMPMPNQQNRTQKHARIHHSFFLVFDKPATSRRISRSPAA